MSRFEELLRLYAEARISAEGSPERLASMQRFEEAVYRASHDGSFNDQLPPDGIKAWVHSTWLDRQRRR